MNSLEIILKNIDKINRLEKQVTDLKDVLQTRKLVDKAKVILMKKYDMDEEKAHRFLQKKSMESRVPLKDIAEEIIKGQGKSNLFI